MFRRLTVCALLLLGMAACQPIDKNLEAEDSHNPHFKKAEAFIEAKNYVEAAHEYEAALQANPNVATAHYELGRIYDEKLGDQVSAMYHYSKFLELRPTSDKREAVQSLLEHAKFNLATQLPNSPVANAEIFAKLQSENANLRKELDDAQARLARLDGQSSSTSTAAPAPAATPAAPATTPAPVATAPASQPVTPPAPATPVAPAATAPAPTQVTEARSHTIAKGETLWKIASKYYKGDVVNGIEKIKAANADKLGDGKPLKIGTVLVIP